MLTPWRDMLPMGSAGDWSSGEGGAEEGPSWPPEGAEDGRGGSSGTASVDEVELRDMVLSAAGLVDKAPETEM